MIIRTISRKILLLVIVDLIVVVGSLFLSAIICFGLKKGMDYATSCGVLLCMTAAIYVFSFYMAGLYDFRKNLRSENYLFVILCVSFTALITIMFCYHPGTGLRPQKGILLINSLLTTLFFLLWRYLYCHLVSTTNFQKKAIIVGAGWAGKTIFAKIKNSTGYGLNIVGFADDDKAKVGGLIDAVPIFKCRNNLLNIVKEKRISQIVLAITHDKHPDLLKELIKCSQEDVVITDMPTLFEDLTGMVPFNHIDNFWLLSCLSMQSRFYAKNIKRGLDIIFALILFLFCLPIIPVICILIKCGSKGDIFFTQERVGKNSSTFNIIKFRSMIQNAEAKTGAVFAGDNDVRITNIGKFLRKWRLDEIPQLLNVIKGDMSLVGPRPERKVFINEYEDMIPFYKERLLAPPGVTGWAQVRFPYASTFEHTEEKLQYDLYYIKNMSFVLDIVVLLQTIKVIIFGKGK